MSALPELNDFLLCDTPDSWLERAVQEQEILLIDHAHCEKKAASTAMNLLYRYVEYPKLLMKMSKIAREELRHFEQVLGIMKKRSIAYTHLSSARYAGGLRDMVRTHEPQRLIDILIVGAFIEARSCERFSRVAPMLDDELKTFYLSLLKSEMRHFQDYLKLAIEISDEDIWPRVAEIAERERQLIEDPDEEFRFHSGAH